MLGQRSLRWAGAGALVVWLRADVPAVQGSLAIARPSTDAAFAAMLDRYARGEIAVEFQRGTSTLEIQGQLRRVGSSLIGPRNAADSARRRLTVATFALEVIDQNIETAWRRGFSGDLLEWSCGLLRDVPATDVERTWHVAAVVQLERASAFWLIRGPISYSTGDSAFVTHVVHAEHRFPGDGRWALARALDAEHAMWPPRLDEDVLRPPPDAENRFRRRIQTAFEQPAVSAEAHLRWGYFHLRRGRLEPAMAEFAAMGAPSDRALRYWQHFFRGQTLVRISRQSEAAESFRHALEAFPSAQASTLALASLLARHGTIVEANDLVSRMLRGGPADDPWNIYGFPTYRHWSILLRQLRTAIAP